jgi:hypothetical protein
MDATSGRSIRASMSSDDDSSGDPFVRPGCETVLSIAQASELMSVSSVQNEPSEDHNCQYVTGGMGDHSELLVDIEPVHSSFEMFLAATLGMDSSESGIGYPMSSLLTESGITSNVYSHLLLENEGSSFSYIKMSAGWTGDFSIRCHYQIAAVGETPTQEEISRISAVSFECVKRIQQNLKR